MCYFTVVCPYFKIRDANWVGFHVSLVVAYYHFICLKSGILLVISFVVSLSYVGVQRLRGISKTLEELRGVWIRIPFFCLVSHYANILSTVKEDKHNCYAFIHLAEEVKRLISLREVKLTKITRDQNRVAHSLANLGRTKESMVCLVHQYPDDIAQL
jgi:hypothetical protein